MPKYLLKVSYTLEGVQGLRSQGGTIRRKAAEAAIQSLGGKLESFYFAFGDCDVYAVAELPDQTAAAAMSLAVSAGGGAVGKTVVLVTPKEMDDAVKRDVGYRPPGS